VRGNLDCNDGELYCIAGQRKAWRRGRSRLELLSGALVVRDDYAIADYDMGAVHPQQRNAPAKVRFFIEHFEQVYAAPGYWVM